MTVNYADYLQLAKILSAQMPRSDAAGCPAHDEHFFIVIHQVAELWFKQILVELESVREAMCQSHVVAQDLWRAVKRLQRVVAIVGLLVEQMKLIQTLSPMEFLTFRSRLEKASGFQSYQFRLMEICLGIPTNNAKAYNLQSEQATLIEQAQQSPSLFHCLERWLEQLPVNSEGALWLAYERAIGGAFSEKKYDALLKAKKVRLSFKAMVNALLIHAYQHHSSMELPYGLLRAFVDIDEGLMSWRQAHASMVFRIIGHRPGTGGSTGYTYLKSTVEKKQVFQDIINVGCYLIPRDELPPLPPTFVEQCCQYQWDEQAS